MRGVFGCPAGRDAAHDADVEVFALRIGRDAEGSDEVEALTDCEAEEAWRRDAHDVVLGAVEDDGFGIADGTAAHLRLPPGVADGGVG